MSVSSVIFALYTFDATSLVTPCETSPRFCLTMSKQFDDCAMISKKKKMETRARVKNFKDLERHCREVSESG